MLNHFVNGVPSFDCQEDKGNPSFVRMGGRSMKRRRCRNKNVNVQSISYIKYNIIFLIIFDTILYYI